MLVKYWDICRLCHREITLPNGSKKSMSEFMGLSQNPSSPNHPLVSYKRIPTDQRPSLKINGSDFHA